MYELALERLQRAANTDGGLGYAPGAPSAAEPTLHAIAAGLAPPEGFLAAQEWRWEALLLGAAMPPGHPLRQTGLDLVLARESDTIPRTVGTYDGELVGWSWVEGTFGWAEPTAWAVLSLVRNGMADHPRCVEGRRLLMDRQCRPAGWNSGAPDALGLDLPPYLYATGLVLLALDPAPELDGAFAYLEEVQRTPSILNVSYALLAKAAHGRPFAWERSWLSQQVSPEDGGLSMRLDHDAVATHALRVAETGVLPFHG